MSASASDKVRNAAPNFATTLGAPIASGADTSMTLSSTVGLPTGTGVTLVIDATNASGIATPSVKEVVSGVVSGVTIVNLQRGQDGTTAQAHSTGANVVMWITANLWNDFQAAFLHNHGQLSGNHLSMTDANGNNWIDQLATTNAVNRLQVANAAAGSGIVLSAVGSDPNINVGITPKGTGIVDVPNGTITTMALKNPYKFFAYVSADYAATIGNQTVHCNAKLYDTGNNFNTSTYTFTALVAGFYRFDGVASVIETGAGNSYVDIRQTSGATTNQFYGDSYATSAAGTFILSVGVDLQLAAGDTVTLNTFTAASQTVNGYSSNAYFSRFSGRLISEA